MSEERIEKVGYKEGYRMSVLLQNGRKVQVNMEPKLVTARFKDLTDFNVFRMGEITSSGKMIKWNDNTEISIEEIMLYVEKT